MCVLLVGCNMRPESMGSGRVHVLDAWTQIFLSKPMLLTFKELSLGYHV